ncbi:hypothetical protein AAVH_16219 [Aphelenchoides avenae]|nr:hypothetical protein AAVH_16219 [Aphelenchus avenae]
MAPLSKDHTGVILPCGMYGTHLDASGKTADEELVRENFAAAGKALAEISPKAEPTEMAAVDTSDDEDEVASTANPIAHVSIVNDTDVFRAVFDEHSVRK